ncbi:MAG: PepSY domain-containing protein, partial [Planctomycetia bacterium]
MKFVQWTLVSFVMVGVLATYCWASNPESDEVVPKNAKSAKDVVSQLQQQGTTNIRSVEYDDNQWNVKTQHGQKETHYKVDAKTGNVTKKKESSEYETAPPNHVLGVLEIINTAEKEGVNGIREVEYDDSLWKVEAVQDGKVTKICFDPIAGDIIWSDTQPNTG